jgi:hypothetical protein
VANSWSAGRSETSALCPACRLTFAQVRRKIVAYLRPSLAVSFAQSAATISPNLNCCERTRSPNVLHSLHRRQIYRNPAHRVF